MRGGIGMARKAQNRANKREYRRPALYKRQKLARVTEGTPAVVTDGRPEPKGGCFRRD